MTFGRKMRSLMNEQGISYRELSRKVHCDYSYLSRIANGKKSPPDTTLADRIDEALGANGQLSALVPVKTRARKSPDLLRGSDAITKGVSGSDMSVMEAFRVADRQVGGGHLYHAVMSYLQTIIAPRFFSEADDDDRSLFRAASALTEMAGWMAHDAGDDPTARQHFGRSLDLAIIGGDQHLQAHIHASMSHLLVHTNEPIRAMSTARRGRKILADSAPNPKLNARLLAMEARSLAALRHPQESIRALRKAEKSLTVDASEVSSPWVSHFDEASLASEKARCMRQIGALQEAEAQARRVISLRPSTHIRSQAFGSLILAKILIAQGRPEEACAVVQKVLSATESLSSYLVVEQLREVRDLLFPYRSNREVGEFLRQMRSVLRDRLLLYRKTQRTVGNDAR